MKSPLDVATSINSKAKEISTVGVSMNYTHTFQGTPNQRMDDSNTWD